MEGSDDILAQVKLYEKVDHNHWNSKGVMQSMFVDTDDIVAPLLWAPAHGSTVRVIVPVLYR